MISSEGYYGSSEVCPNVSGSSDTSCPLHVDCQPSISVRGSPETRFGHQLNFILSAFNNQGSFLKNVSSTNKQSRCAPVVFTVSWVLPAKHTTPDSVQFRVFQNFWGNGNQRFLSTTFAPDRRETLRFAKRLRFLLSPGLQRWVYCTICII